MLVGQLKLVFIHIPKCGGSAIDDAFDIKYKSLSGQKVWNWEHDRPPVFQYEYFQQDLLIYNKHASYTMLKPYYPDWQFINLKPLMYSQKYFLPRKAPRENIKIFRLEDKTIWKEYGLEERKQMVSPEAFKKEIKWTPTLMNRVKDFFAEDMEIGGYA
jgi:hypothetical protein